jgi:hypothetical protein
MLYCYRFTETHTDGAWWKRELVSPYPLFSLYNSGFHRIPEQQGWLE